MQSKKKAKRFKRDCTIHVENTWALISCAVTALLFSQCTLFSGAAAHIVLKHKGKEKALLDISLNFVRHKIITALLLQTYSGGHQKKQNSLLRLKLAA